MRLPTSTCTLVPTLRLLCPHLAVTSPPSPHLRPLAPVEQWFQIAKYHGLFGCLSLLSVASSSKTMGMWLTILGFNFMGDAYWAVMHLAFLDNSAAAAAGANGAESAESAADDGAVAEPEEGWTRAQQMVIYPLIGLCLWNLVSERASERASERVSESASQRVSATRVRVISRCHLNVTSAPLRSARKARTRTRSSRA